MTDQVICLIGLPKVPDTKHTALREYLLKRLDANLKGAAPRPDHLELNIDQDGQTTGLAFAEYTLRSHAQTFLHECKTFLFDKTHVVETFPLGDVDRIMGTKTEYTPPSTERLLEITAPRRWDWNLEGDGADMFMLRHRTAEKGHTNLHWIDIASRVHPEPYWAHQAFEKDLPSGSYFSPLGTFLVWTFRQGLEVRVGGGPNAPSALQTLTRIHAEGTVDVIFSPDEKYVVALRARSAEVFDLLTGAPVHSFTYHSETAFAPNGFAPLGPGGALIVFSADSEFVALAPLRPSVRDAADKRPHGKGKDVEVEDDFWTEASLFIYNTTTWKPVEKAGLSYLEGWPKSKDDVADRKTRGGTAKDRPVRTCTDKPAVADVSGFAFAPSGHHLVYWSKEVGQTPAVVAVVDPANDLREVASKGLFRVRSIDLHWAPTAEVVLCRVVSVTRRSVEAPVTVGGPKGQPAARVLKVEEASLAVLRLPTHAARRQVRSVEVNALVTDISWQPNSSLVAIASAEDAASNATSVSVFDTSGASGSDLALVAQKAFPRRVAVSWAPTDNVFVLADPRGDAAAPLAQVSFTFCRLVLKKKTGKEKKAAAAAKPAAAAAGGAAKTPAAAAAAAAASSAANAPYEIDVVKDVSASVQSYAWSPSGRFFAAWRDSTASSLRNEYSIWSLFGDLVVSAQPNFLDGFEWRPWLPSLLSEAKRAEVERTLPSRIEQWRARRGPNADPAIAEREKKRQTMTAWKDWRRARQMSMRELTRQRQQDLSLASVR